MNKKATLFIGVISIAALLSIPAYAEKKHQGHKMQMAAATTPSKTGCHNVHEIHMKKLSQAMMAIDKAVKSIEADNKDKALAELAEAKKLVAACHLGMSQIGKGKIVNARCPIMGSKLDPNRVPEKLTRTYMGKKVGFCCGGCPAAWDKLSKEEQAKKLKKNGDAEPKHTSQTHKEHMGKGKCNMPSVKC